MVTGRWGDGEGEMGRGIGTKRERWRERWREKETGKETKRETETETERRRERERVAKIHREKDTR